MNRLAPLVTRYAQKPAPARALVLRPAHEAAVEAFLGTAPRWAGDLRLFATAWLGGLIFFGTFLA